MFLFIFTPLYGENGGKDTARTRARVASGVAPAPMFFASSTARLKTTLRLCLARLKLIKNKKNMQMQVLKKEVADLLEAGKDESAKIRGACVERSNHPLACSRCCSATSMLMLISSSRPSRLLSISTFETHRRRCSRVRNPRANDRRGFRDTRALRGACLSAAAHPREVREADARGHAGGDHSSDVLRTTSLC